MEKRCRVCKEIKPIDSFGKNKGASDGLQSGCRICLNDAARRRRLDPVVRERQNRANRLRCQNPEYKRRKGEAAKLRMQDPEYRERKQAANRLRRESPKRRGSRHGLTADEYLSLVGDGMCDVGCGRPGTCVDHDHTCCPGERSCGKCVRGWLCRSCNVAEGNLPTPETARALADYMERTMIRTETP